MLAKYLATLGHRVHIAECCQSARLIFEANERIDVLILDLGLPDGDGCDLLRELSAIRRVPAIALTGHAMVKDVERVRTAGFIAHLAKPLPFPNLESLLSKIDLGLAPIEPPIEAPTPGPERRSA